VPDHGCATHHRLTVTTDRTEGLGSVVVARYFDVHPRDPQPRLVAQVVAMLRDDALIAYPTDSCYALGFELDSRTGADRIRRIRHLDDRHHFTLVCSNFAQLGEFVQLSNAEFRAIKAATPGPYTFILAATREVPKRLAHPRKRTVGVRIPDHRFVRALLRQLGKPLVSSTLLLPGEDEPMSDGWAIKDRFDHEIDAVIDAGSCGIVPTTVIDFTEGYPEVVRVGAGDPAPFV
jgi:tRNA threonylcarbamoyl adenosine modification protein (Sua5/YciO/YrdC/YwlC family)